MLGRVCDVLVGRRGMKLAPKLSTAESSGGQRKHRGRAASLGEKPFEGSERVLSLRGGAQLGDLGEGFVASFLLR